MKLFLIISAVCLLKASEPEDFDWRTFQKPVVACVNKLPAAVMESLEKVVDALGWPRSVLPAQQFNGYAKVSIVVGSEIFDSVEKIFGDVVCANQLVANYTVTCTNSVEELNSCIAYRLVWDLYTNNQQFSLRNGLEIKALLQDEKFMRCYRDWFGSNVKRLVVTNLVSKIRYSAMARYDIRSQNNELITSIENESRTLWEQLCVEKRQVIP